MALVQFNLHPSLPASLMENRRTIKLGFSFKDLEIISVTPDNDLLREQARFEVSLLQLRPTLQDGQPVNLENVQLQYRFPPQYTGFTLSEN